ncbi:MAG TPA: DUF3783 domain-containing protein [Candidatus Bariatricus faecipullorum]|nr:DUF3783 domain-containing protein [Candidatus Bariatricus faecipullorum]
MREVVLLVNFQDKKQLREIQMMLLTVKLRMRMVSREEYLQTLGYLAGVKGMEAGQETYEGEELGREMMVFAGVTEEHLNQMLFLMKKGGVKPVDYKAVLTDTNKDWNILQLYKEISQEHEAMNQVREK